MTVFVSSHAIDRYRQRIERVPAAEVCLRIREAVGRHIHDNLEIGEYKVSARSKGPKFDAVVRVHPGGRADVITISPVTNQQITRSIKSKTWR